MHLKNNIQNKGKQAINEKHFQFTSNWGSQNFFERAPGIDFLLLFIVAIMFRNIPKVGSKGKKVGCLWIRAS